ncbi:MAG: hypothetical protein QOE58_2544 [Actinomycetota bacterium]|jgi:hypothetical protein|nr:hypothetical protein [Actinomycetota bacterium]
MVEHLERDFDGAFNRAEIQDCVAAALSDLSGSICLEALNEMAYKLASYRLKARLDRAAGSEAGDLITAQS